MNSYMKKSDFLPTGRSGTKGMTLRHDQSSFRSEQERKPAPCEGCPNRQRCKNEALACESYQFFCKDETYYRPTEYYLSRDRVPSKQHFKAVWGDYDPCPDVAVEPKPKAAHRGNVREAIASAEEASYPSPLDMGKGFSRCDIIRLVGSYSTWRRGQNKVITKLRNMLAEQQAEA